MVKVAFVLLLEQGHLQVCSSIGKYLLARSLENEVIFITDEEFEPVIKRECSKFQTIVFKQPEGAQEEFKKRLNNKLDVWNMEYKEAFQVFLRKFPAMITLWKGRQFIIRDIIQSIPNLDFLFIENLFNLPFLMNIGCKWGMIISTNPLRIADPEKYPVCSSGTTDPNETKEYLKLFKENSIEFRKEFDEWYEEFGLKRELSLTFIQGSDYLNVYLWPDQLKYFKPEDLKGKWVNLNSSICSKVVNEKLQDYIDVNKKLPGKELLTPEFLSKKGKLILFSLGTVVTRTLEVFEKIFQLLANIPHKFIVCKGKFGDKLDLPPNCVGSNMINQLELLPLVDLFITHCGNNSFTEAIYFGVPMLAIPAFGDQIDNAARLLDLNLGRSLHIAKLTKENLQESIDYILNNDDIKRRMKEISDSIRNEKKDRLDEICDLIYKECEK